MTRNSKSLPPRDGDVDPLSRLGRAPAEGKTTRRLGPTRLAAVSPLGRLIALITALAPTPVVANPWTALFDGQTLEGWNTLDGRSVTTGWEVVDGAIHLNRTHGRGGNIVTARSYDNYQLVFQWKNSPGGNSGLKYRVRKYGTRTLGCEYQILDPQKPEPPNKGSTGSLYDVYEPRIELPLNPVGQFNQSRIVVWGNHIEHWLNGTLIVEAEVGSDQWRRRIAESKFADVQGFGEPGPGKIMLTDHGSEVWYRNIFLLPLPSWTDSSTGSALTVRCQPCYGGKPRLPRRPWLRPVRLFRCR